MKYTAWTIATEDFVPEKRQSRDALFTVGNGYMGVRGFFEEDEFRTVGNGGLYVGGVFGAGTYDAWEGRSRESCNLAHALRLRITIDGKRLDGVSDTADYMQTLDMQRAVYTRRYRWNDTATLQFERFADRVCVNRIGQKLTITAEKPLNLCVEALLDSRVVNLNEESCEPLPIQPGRNHITARQMDDNRLETVLDDPDQTTMTFAQHVVFRTAQDVQSGVPVSDDYAVGRSFACRLEAGETLCMEKSVYICSTKAWDNTADLATFLASPPDYLQMLTEHEQAWNTRWRDADITVDTDTDDQTALRYDLFELMCACPEHTDQLSIGARGLTGEMYEGCVFWDNEIFQLPFFTYTNPKAARNLLKFRYHTLDAARRHAVKNWFGGAMYPWQVSETGIEQTPYNVGAFYAIHIVSDIAYAIRQYWKMTGDTAFLAEGAAEVLVETARFWVSRSDYREKDGHYHIRAVRGPNEYDVFVNDNAYTNVMAAENLRSAAWSLTLLEKEYPQIAAALMTRLSITTQEREHWQSVAEKLAVCRKGDLVVEDDAYLDRRPLDLKRAKPTAKRIIDSTLPYEALPLYQVTKQSDTVTLLCLQPDLFSLREKEVAYDFYEPRTAHDSSLSYAPYGWLAAELGREKTAYEYFRRCAYLDIEDLKLNTVSGLHFANFGGTWQVTVFGFAGVSLQKDGLHVTPRLPSAWKSMGLSLYYHGTRLHLQIGKDTVSVTAEKIHEPIRLCLCGQEVWLTADQPSAAVKG